ncbi:hypothetical protein ACGF13_09035 [Kitasatospora sp. NPDC048286]|uniref:hypothetical protein n=1 Tax=Kitasatospora sp. NPDC048286 TaxID=3364047 RepID=UPI0037240A56
MSTEPTPRQERYEIHLIDAKSPHFRLLECWALWDRDRHQHVHVPRSSERIMRFYTQAAAEAFLRYAPDDAF